MEKTYEATVLEKARGPHRINALTHFLLTGIERDVFHLASTKAHINIAH